MKNLFYKAYKTFLILSGLFFGFVYNLLIITCVNKYIFSDESIAAFKFTFSNLIFIPISLLLAYISILIIMYIVNTVKNHFSGKPDKILAFKHIGLLAAVLIATFVAMQFHTILYTDGCIESHNCIKALSPEYTVENYSKINFYGENVSSISPKHPYRNSFQFYLVFHVDEDKYIEFYPEEFRDNQTIKVLGETLGEKFSVLPEEGLPSSSIANMSENEYELYKIMYSGRTTAETYYEEETEQEHYAFDGNHDF